jgi:hypothetical protein
MFFWNQLDRIEEKLDRVLRMERIIMADEAALDQALTDLGAHVSDLQAAAQAIIDKVSNLPNAPDLSDEIATIQGFGSKVGDTTDAINAAVAGGTTTPTPEPTP